MYATNLQLNVKDNRLNTQVVALNNKGIRTYSNVLGRFLAIFCCATKIQFNDQDGKVCVRYVNKNSFARWRDYEMAYRLSYNLTPDAIKSVYGEHCAKRYAELAKYHRLTTLTNLFLEDMRQYTINVIRSVVKQRFDEKQPLSYYLEMLKKPIFESGSVKGHYHETSDHNTFVFQQQVKAYAKKTFNNENYFGENPLIQTLMKNKNFKTIAQLHPAILDLVAFENKQ